MTRSLPARLLPAVALAASLVVGGCAADPDASRRPAGGTPEGAGVGAAASCVAGLTYAGAFYLASDTGSAPKGEPLEGAELPACNDTGGEEGRPTPIDAFAIDGVDPRYAVLAEGPGGRTVYVADTYAPGLADAEPLPVEVADALGLG